MKMNYRLGLDLGANSLGWCLLELNDDDRPFRIVRLGSRIFSDGRNPKDKTSLAVARRDARQMRRRRDRFLKRRSRLLNTLQEHGFLPAIKTERDALFACCPYSLRAKGLDSALTPYEFGRVVFHLNQRRGFKSNRKIDKSGEKESGKIKDAIAASKNAMQGLRTIGEWLAKRHAERQSVRARLLGTGAKVTYDLYVDRQMIEDEFKAIYEKQAALQPDLYPSAIGKCLLETLLHQRRLRPVKPGRCTLEPNEERAPLALPSVQRFRILQELNNICIVQDDLQESQLTLPQRDLLKSELERNPKVLFDKMRRLLNLPNARFNLESEQREFLKGNATTVAMSKDRLFGTRWHQFSLAEQDTIIHKLHTEESETVLIDWLQTTYELSVENASAIANSGLPEGYGRLSCKALNRIIPCLQAEVITYDQAVVQAGFESHSQFHTGELQNNLPYYGEVLQRHVAFAKDNPRNEEERWGKIANPTVHIGLNQVRKIVNAVIDRYGRPKQVVVELARELKQNSETKERIKKEQSENQKRNIEFGNKMAEIGISSNGDNLLRMKLWTELNEGDPLNRRCPYTGEQISIQRLLSSDVEIDHILPFAKTLDDSYLNKTICIRRANAYKSNRTPYEAFGESQNGYNWDTIRERVRTLHKGKQKRFMPDAMQTWLRDNDDFLARHLTDTQYLSRIAREYLMVICPPNQVTVTPGRLTALLRGKWGLNSLISDSKQKNREDHRHHAIDAAVIAVTDRWMLNCVATAASHAREKQLNKIIENMPLPFPMYREALETAIQRMVVSYKPDHGWQGQLHNQTAYGLIGNDQVVHRVPLAEPAFKSSKDFDKIRDTRLRNQLIAFVGPTNGTTFKERLLAFSREHNVHRVRVTEKLKTVPIYHPGQETPYKGYDPNSNYCIEIFRGENGRWKGEVISTFQAAQIARIDVMRLEDRALGQNGQQLVMRLCKDDLVAIDDGVRKIYRVVKISTNGQTFFAEHHEANVDARNTDKEDKFKYMSKSAGSLNEIKARRVFVDMLGFVKDPGFRP